ncbi:MAG: hypothetical protein ACO1PZ_05665 [Gammaproteobacteria bacterium]
MKTKLLFSAVCAAALMGNSAIADDEKAHADLSAWDTDSDKIVTQEEWADYMEKQNLFDRIDKNNNGNFDVEEAAEGVLDYDVAMDLDDGGTISRDEFIVGLYDHYDENDDDKLDDTEFDTFASVEGSPLWMDESESAEN